MIVTLDFFEILSFADHVLRMTERSEMDSIYSDPDKPGSTNRFKKPFKIYENFRNVYKGVRRNSGSASGAKGSYAFEAVAAASATAPDEEEHHHVDGDAREDGPIGEDCNLEMVASAAEATSAGGGEGASADENGNKKPASNDGNSTDDSGIDSFSDNASPEPNAEDAAAGGAGGGEGRKRNVWKRDLNEAKASESKKSNVELKSVKSKVRETVMAIESKYGDVTPIYSKVNKVRTSATKVAAVPVGKSDLKELSKMLNDTGNLLSRNSNLRASLTITMKKRNKAGGPTTKTTTTILLPTPKLDRKKAMLVEFEEEPEEEFKKPEVVKETLSETESVPAEEVVVIQETNREEVPDPEKNPFIRHNPARKPTARRSMRLAPKTVVALATRFDSLLQNSAAAGENKKNEGGDSPVKKTSPGKLSKNKDISSIISALNKLDEEASKDTAVLRRSLRRAALQQARDEKKKAKEGDEAATETAAEDVGAEDATTAAVVIKNEVDDKEVDKSSEDSEGDYAQTSLTEYQEEDEEDYYEKVEPPPDRKYYESEKNTYAEIGDRAATFENGELPEDNIVTAKPAIVLEDQLDSLSYVCYDEVMSWGGLGKGGLYESIAGSILNLARLKGGRGEMVQDSSDNPDDVLNYTLSKLSEASNVEGGCGGDGDKSSDEWIDVDDDTDEYETAEAEAFSRNRGFIR
jgi:hypothetical protein